MRIFVERVSYIFNVELGIGKVTKDVLVAKTYARKSLVLLLVTKRGFIISHQRGNDSRSTRENV